MKKILYIPLKFKLTFFITVLIALISLFLFLYFPKKFENERLESLEEKANSIAKIAAYGISSGLYLSDQAASNVEIESLIKNESIRYIVIFKSDSIFYSYNAFTAVLNDYKNQNNGAISKKWEILKSYAPITFNNEKIGEIYLGFSLNPVYAKIDELRISIGIVSFLLFLFSAGLIYFMVNIFTNPLSNIVNFVHKITDGDLSQRLNVNSNDEVGFLANSFNGMVEKISSTNEEMDVINKELENRVHDRTRELEEALRSLQKENSQRKHAELAISKSLKEKEILLKEIHHRVKNNLQIVSSLFFFQSQQLSDPTTLEMFRDGQNRVKTMALIHEKLYQSGDLANIDFKEYIKKLTNFLFQSYGVDQTKIKLKNNVQQVMLGVDIAVPCGLIINELISNSLKHGLRGCNSGEVRIDMGYDENDKLILKISDNGKGMPSNFNVENSDSLGLRLVFNLTTQLNGNVKFFNNNGTVVKILFPNPHLKKAS